MELSLLWLESLQAVKLLIKAWDHERGLPARRQRRQRLPGPCPSSTARLTSPPWVFAPPPPFIFASPTPTFARTCGTTPSCTVFFHNAARSADLYLTGNFIAHGTCDNPVRASASAVYG